MALALEWRAPGFSPGSPSLTIDHLELALSSGTPDGLNPPSLLHMVRGSGTRKEPVGKAPVRAVASHLEPV